MSTPDPYAPQPPPQPYGQPVNPYAPPAYGYPPAYPTPPSKPTDGVSVAALVTGVVGIWPAAIVCGFLGIRRTRADSPQQGRGFAIAGLVLGFLWLLGTIAAVAVVIAVANSPAGHNVIGLARGDRILVSSLSTGDCFELPSSRSYGLLSSVPRQSCAGSHDAEVIDTIELRDSVDYPGQSSLVSLASQECNAAFSDLRAAHPDETSLRLGLLVPGSSGWSNGDRRAVCVVADRNGNRTGSLANSGAGST